MTKIVVYGSRYGSTKRYAEKFADKHNLPVIPFKSLTSLSEYHTIYHFGALLAGGTYGIKQTAKLLDTTKEQQLVVITVGISNPNNQENKDNIQQVLMEQLGEDLFSRAEIYHLRGTINYKKLTLTHRFMMYLIYKLSSRKPVEEQNQETRDLIETYNQTVNFVDFDTLNQIQ